MSFIKNIYKLAIALAIFSMVSCDDKLTEVNIDPNVVDPAVANPNMIMPTILATAATDYLNKGWDIPAGVVQHIQHDSWNSGINHYDWGPSNWANYYDMLRNNNFLLNSPNAAPFHRGVALTMKSFLFGMITDLWGDAPYTDALKGDQGIFEPAFDSQETIYRGILADLQAATEIFATGDNTGYLSGYDVYYGGNTQKWHQFANSLILRYAMRISEKLPDLAKSTIERVTASGIYIKTPADDAVISFVGTQASNAWPFLYMNDDSGRSNFRRRKPAKALVDQLLNTNDPRLSIWWNPVHVQWVEDRTLTEYLENVIRQNGVKLDIVTMSDPDFEWHIGNGSKFTRHFNPDLKTPGDPDINTNLFVGLPAGMVAPYSYNGNPTPGQDLENQHVSLMSQMYRWANDPSRLKARIISASEIDFILAEAALKGWAVGGNAESHYLSGIRNSFITWKTENEFNDFVAHEAIKFNNSRALEQIITQKWIASYTGATEAWMDFRRTGIPALKAGPASQQPVLPVRFIYGGEEQLANSANIKETIDRLEQSQYTNQLNSQWSKPWIIQGTTKPW